MATRMIEGAGERAAIQKQANTDNPAGRPGNTRAARVLALLRANKPRVIVLMVVAGCVLGFATWLDAQLRPAVVARERREMDAEERLEATMPCHAGQSHTEWCGAIALPVRAPAPALPLVDTRRAPLGYCTAGPAPSC
ncbi:hypothetical protein [Paraburkholderia tropica]|nr:hypothetical protein [Paraburkholderia tropica]MBB2980529.1 hypothetical protein [Paraburkholderia tropica]MBB3000209.1 hypothetical protein [Paraburkholderia tropica]MBB6319840.1 hypothetical protein [Paraburkholderia tropica]MDE1144467.1 hypothetical protein [Paraburkholderia tropica]